ncbi:MAG: nucleoside hydrolase [Pirellulales bacterium]
MARKVILDVDPGVDDAVAMCLALAAPELDVVAVTAVGGNVAAEQATRNVQAIVEQLDPRRWPRLGAASGERILRADARHIFGTDGLCGAHFPCAELHHRRPSVKVISDEVQAAPGDVTIIALGPLSNIAAALQQQPELASQIGHLIILGGTVSGPGNVTPAAEFNIYCDAEAARDVFRSPVTKTVIPIDVTNRVLFGFDMLQKIPSGPSRTSQLVQRLLPGAFRSYRQNLGLEGIHLHDAVAVVAAIHPELFTMERMHGEVEIDGTLTHGATVFDRRRHPESRPNLDVAVEVDAEAVADCIYRTLNAAS